MKFPAPGNFLLRSWVIIVLGIIGIALLLDSLLALRNRQDLEAELRDTYAPLFALLQNNLAPLPPDARSDALQERVRDWDLPAALLDTSDFAGDPLLSADLDSGELLVFSNDEAAPLLYQRLADSKQVLALGPLPQRGGSNSFDRFIISAYYILVGLLVLLWIRPFYRDLTRLRQAAAEFGQSDFSTRVRLSEKSSILPVAQSFNNMADRIDYLVSAHRELTHAVSHELRTPLARFRFSLEILSRNKSPERRNEYIRGMKADIDELEALIDELLNYARLSEENLLTNLVDMDLRAWLQAELKQYDNARCNIICCYNHHSPDGSYRVNFNPDLMGRAIHNVIRNALRYAHNDINIRVLVNGDVEIRICDDGPGVPPDRQTSIFEPFCRVESSRDRETGGYGLGLAIAARVLQRHSGSIRMENVRPNGACFILRWPAY